MPTMRVSPYQGRPLLDIASFARRGPARRDRLTPAELALIARTVARTPEAVVKVLPKASNSLSAVSRHVHYIGRKGDLDLETDDGERIRGDHLGQNLVEDWDLDLEASRRTPELGSGRGRTPPKLVHKLMLSMPPGTPPEGVRAAAQNFLREQFALKHRYAFVLHTDEPHPHIHALVKAVSEQGIRLNIKKSTLREWRSEFARHLRAQGIEANATERVVRGISESAKRDGIYRAARRGASTFVRDWSEAVESAELREHAQNDPSEVRRRRTQDEIQRGWAAAARDLESIGRATLAGDVRRFFEHMRGTPEARKRTLESAASR